MSLVCRFISEWHAVSVSATYVQVLTTFAYENHWFLLQNLWFLVVSYIYFLLFLHYISFRHFKTSFPTNISIFFLSKHDIINFRPGGNQILDIWMKILDIWLIDKGDLCQNFPAPRAHSRHAHCGKCVIHRDCLKIRVSTDFSRLNSNLCLKTRMLLK